MVQQPDSGREIQEERPPDVSQHPWAPLDCRKINLGKNTRNGSPGWTHASCLLMAAEESLLCEGIIPFPWQKRGKSTCMLREFKFREPLASTNVGVGVSIHFYPLKGSEIDETQRTTQSPQLSGALDFHRCVAYLANHRFVHQPMGKHFEGSPGGISPADTLAGMPLERQFYEFAKPFGFSSGHMGKLHPTILLLLDGHLVTTDSQ